MSNLQAVRVDLQRKQQANLRMTAYFSLRIKELQRDLNAQKEICNMLQDQLGVSRLGGEGWGEREGRDGGVWVRKSVH